MRLIAPYPRHPLLWALVDLCGLSLGEIARRTNLSRSVIQRTDWGIAPSPDQVVALRRLLDWARDQLPGLVPAVDECPPVVRAYRRALFAVLAQVLADSATGDDPASRTTQLEEDLLACLGHGRRVSDVLSDLRRAHRAASVRRCARRLGCPKVLRDGAWWWLPPTDHPAPGPRQFVPPAPAPPQPRTPVSVRVANAISIFLGRRPGQCAPGPEVVDAVHARVPEVARSTIYRVARQMRLVREVHGFGADKRSTWTLPPAPPVVRDEHLDDEGDGERVALTPSA